MIINLFDPALAMPAGEAKAGVINAKWQYGTPLPSLAVANAGARKVEILRVIAPQIDISTIVDHVKHQLPFLKALLSPGGIIEVYGRPSRQSNTIGGSLGRDAMNTIGGVLGKDAMNTIGGSLGRDAMNTIGGFLSRDAMNTIGGSLSRDLLWRLAGTMRVCLKP